MPIGRGKAAPLGCPDRLAHVPTSWRRCSARVDSEPFLGVARPRRPPTERPNTTTRNQQRKIRFDPASTAPGEIEIRRCSSWRSLDASN